MRTVYVQQLLDSKPNNFSQTKKEWEDEIYSYLVSNTSRSWSRGGITMMFGQLVVNSPDRVKLGSLRDMFIDGEDIVYYDDMFDCIEKMNYYNENEEERERIAHNGMMKVLHNYTQIQLVDNLIQKYENFRRNL
jgi:hypothetical protein